MSPLAVLFVLLCAVGSLAACDPGHTITVRNETPWRIEWLREQRGAARKFFEPGGERKVSTYIAPEPVLSLLLLAPSGAKIRFVRTTAELEASGWVVVIQREDFERHTPVSP
jgi:hypothetical protein